MKKLTFILFSIFILSLTACGQNNTPSVKVMDDTPNSNRTEFEVSTHVVKLGFIGPITGPVAAEGTAARNAFQMAIDDANNSGRFIEMYNARGYIDPIRHIRLMPMKRRLFC